MATHNGSIAISLSFSLVLVFATGCAPIRGGARYGDRPAEIVLPASNSPGGLDRIRNDLLPFTRGPLHRHTRPATCNNCVVDVDIQSVGLTTDVVPLNGPAAFRIIGRVFNTDSSDTESSYNFKPRREYLMWIAPAALNSKGTSRTKWGFLELLPGPTGPINPQTIGYVERCPHTKPGPSFSNADFRNCEQAAIGHAADRFQRDAIFVSLLSLEASVAKMVIAGDGWFDCGAYCCTGTNLLH